MTKVEVAKNIHLQMWILFYIWCGKCFFICKFNRNQYVLIELALSKLKKVFRINFHICKWIYFANLTFDRRNTFCLLSSSLSSMESAVVNGPVQLEFTKLSLTLVDLAKKLKHLLSCNFFFVNLTNLPNFLNLASKITDVRN